MFGLLLGTLQKFQTEEHKIRGDKVSHRCVAPTTGTCDSKTTYSLKIIGYRRDINGLSVQRSKPVLALTVSRATNNEAKKFFHSQISDETIGEQ